MRSLNLRVVIPSCMGLLLIFATLGITQLGNAGAQQNIDRSKLTPQAVLAQVANDESRPTPTNTPVPGATATNTPKSTQTGGATNTATSSPTVTQTPSPTKTTGPGTPTATATNTAVPTNTPTATSSPTATNTPVTGSTNTPTPTNTPVTPTATSTPVTPTATPTTVSSAPHVDSISPTEAIEGINTNFQLYGSNFVEPSTVEFRPAGGSYPYTPIPASRIGFFSPTHIAFNYQFGYYPQGAEIRVTGSTGASNAVLLTIVEAPPPPCIGPGETFSNPFAIMQWSHGRPCNGDNVTLTVTLSSGTNASAMYFRFANGTCLPTKHAFTGPSIDGEGREVWTASAVYSYDPTEHFGYRIVAARTGSGDLFWNEPTTAGGSPFGGSCEFPPQAP